MPPPPQIPSHPGFHHVNHASSASASPPISHNAIPFAPRHGTPQPQGVSSRPSSRTHMRRVSSNLAPQQHATPPPPAPTPPQQQQQQQPQPHPQNGFAYMYQNQRPPGPFAQFGHPPPVTHHHTPPPMPAHTMPSQSIPHNPMAPPHAQHHPFAQPHPPMAMPQVAQAYMHEQGRNSLPPGFGTPGESQPQPQQPSRTLSVPDASSDGHGHVQGQGQGQGQGQTKGEGSQSPPTQHHRSLSSKSRSIFTPIDDRGSVLARHFGLTAAGNEVARALDPGAKHDPNQDAPGEDNPAPSIPPPPAPRGVTDATATATRTQSISSLSSEIMPPTRTNSGQSKRPQLKVQIPSEHSEGGSATADDSSRDSAGNKTLTPAKASLDPNQPGVVLPPPSPSAGAILSAGAQGPPNPFARPPPPQAQAAAAATATATATATASASASQNNNAYANNNNIDTPISALPSRFVSDALLPSPSSFFPEWGFGRSGPDSNMLPSPLAFPTPAAQTGPGFAREDEQDKKRKTPDSGPNAESSSKKTKT